MARQPGVKNKTRIEMTLPSWYGDKLKELRVDSGFESDLRLRMEQALPAPVGDQ